MIFPQYNYKNFNNKNKSEWALQPPTNENWNIMVNEAHKYCKNLTDVFEFEDYCKETDLPSFHPYWSLQVNKNTISLIEQTRGLIAQAKMYIRNGGFYSSNANSMISQHKESLKFYCSKLNFR